MKEYETLLKMKENKLASIIRADGPSEALSLCESTYEGGIFLTDQAMWKQGKMG
ncbi:hypothetical protein JSY36_18720 [Bacillus sp. H-16]|uniref:hypothetical protein n=1 Tax=Alteribacter salitolerans TaxID=2912333 RepID=UPI00196380BA|nr:hypothetical protein [Alteribacter salitolerans]MBM7097774.1 hypothetical protein [Alteribacter salitolerans]